MDPCGMIADHAVSLSYFRMQLSDDPDDWVWARTYWTQPDARPLPLWSAYQNPVTDTPNGVSFVGPQFQYEPRRVKRRRFLGEDPRTVTERPTVYARSAVSPHPGVDYRGQPDWYADGVPVESRAEVDFGPGCEGEVWSSGGSLTYGVDTDMPDVIAVGGGAGPGRSLEYPEYVVMRGGGAGPGRSLEYPEYVVMRGGGAGGGLSRVYEGVVMRGGGAGAGLSRVYLPHVMRGGGAGGGVSYADWPRPMEGGGAGAGTSTVDPCFDVPSYVGGTPQSGFGTIITLPLPEGTSTDDTVIAIALGEFDPDATIDPPLGYVPFLDVELPGGDDRMLAWYFNYHFVPVPAEIVLRTESHQSFTAALFVVRGSTVTTNEFVATGTTPPAVLPAATIHDRCALVVRVAYNGPAFGPAYVPDGWTQWADQDPFDGLAAWYKDDVNPGELEAMELPYDNEDDWGTITMVFYRTVGP